MGNPAAVTLVIGDEELLSERAIAAVVAVVRETEPQAEVHDLVGSKVEPGELTRLTSPSLFGDWSVVVIRSAQDLAKDVITEMVTYATHPAGDAALVLAHPGGVKGKALVDGLKRPAPMLSTSPTITMRGVRRI
jgi:DNA polymerase-3 subunit delta